MLQTCGILMIFKANRIEIVTKRGYIRIQYFYLSCNKLGIFFLVNPHDNINIQKKLPYTLHAREFLLSLCYGSMKAEHKIKITMRLQTTNRRRSCKHRRLPRQECRWQAQDACCNRCGRWAEGSRSC